MKTTALFRFLGVFLFTAQLVSLFAAAPILIPAGTLVKLNLEESLSTRTNKTGQMVRFSVVEDIKIGNRTVIKKGATARAQLEKVRSPGRFGRNGSLKLRYLTVTSTNGKELPIILGEKSIKTNEQMGMAAGASLGGYMLLGPVGLAGGIFVRGKHIDIPKDTQLMVETAKDSTY